MNSSLKAVLLSGLVFPGLGQFALKHYRRATVIALATLISLSVVIVKAVQHALALLEQLELQGGAVTVTNLSNTALQAASSANSLTFNLFGALVIICWLVGIVDAYNIGKKKGLE
jgi:hypothetical protein